MTEQEWLKNNKLSLDIWNNKYRYNNETFEEWLDRVSGGNFDVRKEILNKQFIFGGRILANRGIPRRTTLSNCYVIPPVEDNIESIFKSAAELARTYSLGGGCGIDVSKLRPKGAKVNNAAKTTTGCTSFMDFFSYVTGLIGQEGRRGALMVSIDCTHPDLEEFINLKTNLNVCTKANISVRVSDEFMEAVQNNLPWKLSFTTEHETIEKTINAREIFMLLAKRNWEMAEPGILYWDRITNYNLVNKDLKFSFAGVNPCAEEPLPAYGACLLGSINLAEFVVNPFTKKASVDINKLDNTIRIAVRALNKVLDEGIPLHPLQEQKECARKWRQIGLGTMGLGDMLIKLGIKYGSDEGIKLINSLFRTIATTSVLASLELAKENGYYPMCDTKALLESSFLQALDLDEETLKQIATYGLANSQLLTCAPTGSIGTMLQVSTGVEPNFAFSYQRRTVSLNKEETYYTVDADIVSDYKKVTGNNTLPDYFVSSADIKPLQRIKVQAALQKWIDASISSTINLPNSTTIEEVADIYLQAWKYGLKGVTIWRDGCQRQGILSTTKELKRGDIIKANDNCIGLKRSLVTGCGTLHCEAFFDPITGDLRECYLSKGSTGGCNNFMIGLSRMISLAARGGVEIYNILDQLKSCGTCPSYAVRKATKNDVSKGSSCPVAVGYALKDMYNEIIQKLNCCNQESREIEQVKELTDYEECPKCHHKTLIHQGGCVSCSNCCYSKCE